MILQLQPYSDKPIYEQLILEIKRGIATGEIAPNEGLPSVRSLAADIGINLHTVNKVYKHLQSEGVLLKEKSGFVAKGKPLELTGDTKKKLLNHIYELVIEKELYGLSDEDILKMMKEVKLKEEMI